VCARVETAQDRGELFALLFADQIGFVDNQDVTEFNLFNQQIDHRTFVKLAQRLATRFNAVA